MNRCVLFTGVILDRARPQVSLPIKIDIQLLCYQNPDPDVEFAIIIQQRPFNILLDDPLISFFAYELNYFPCVAHYRNTTSLVHIRWFNDPDVLWAVFQGDALVIRFTFFKLSETSLKLLQAMIWTVYRDNEGGRRAVKHLVTALFCLLWIFIVSF